MRSEIKRDIGIMSVLIVLCAIFYFLVIPAQISESSIYSGDIWVNSQTYPKMVAIATTFVATLELVRNALKLRKLPKEEAPVEKDPDAPAFKTVALTTGGLYVLYVAYALLFNFVGFAIPTLLILPAILYVLGVRKPKNYMIILVFSFSIFVIFRYLLSMNITFFGF